MNELIEPGLNLIKTCPPPRLEGIFLSSVVVIVFNKNGPIRIHYLRVCLWVLLGLRHKEFVVLRSVKYLKICAGQPYQVLTSRALYAIF